MVTAVPPPAGLPVIPFLIPIPGQRTATVTPIKAKMPTGFRVLGVSAYARASGGTSPTLTVDVLQAATSLLASAIALTADTVAEGTLAATPVIPDEAELSVVLTIGGTNPTWDDISVLLTLVRN